MVEYNGYSRHKVMKLNIKERYIQHEEYIRLEEICAGSEKGSCRELRSYSQRTVRTTTTEGE